jgi:UDP-N-acetylglucosamine 1-carboxyvinyltransferase
MGANIKLMDAHRILINGPSTLTGTTITSTDIRAGLAYVIAALIAKGRSVIHNVSVIDRGYEKIDERLTGIGAQISRLEQ